MTWRPDWVICPGEILREELQERGLRQSDLAEAMGFTQKHISMVICGHAKIVPEFALRLEEALGGPSAEFWLNLERDYRLGLLRGATEIKD